EEVAARRRTWRGRGAGGLALVHLAQLLPDAFGGEARRAIPVAGWRSAATWPLRSLHPLELFRGTRRRWVQLWIAAVALERPGELPAYLLHRATREGETGGV